MIKVKAETALTAENLIEWYKIWYADYERINANYEMLINKQRLKMPFAKKMVLTSAAATLGDGMTISAPEKLEATAQATFDEIQNLWKKQTIINHDAGIIKYGCTCGRSYELCYMSDDAINPIPKVAKIKATNAFVVFDDTVENNSLYGVCFDTYYKTENTIQEKYIKFYIYDLLNKYEYEVKSSFLDGKTLTLPMISLDNPEPHNMGRMPLTEIHNNEEEQGDFEQVIDLIKDRSTIHDTNLKDFKRIAKNYMAGRNLKFTGKTKEEKAQGLDDAGSNQFIEYETDSDNTNDGAYILSKSENYSSITEFGKDVDSKIYDLSMIPDLSSQEFAGNLTGVALDLKLLPFKQMIKTKEPELEKAIRRRIKMYMHALVIKEPTKYAEFDAAECTIKFNRNWTKNIVEIVQVMQGLKALGTVSDKTITNELPDIDYEDEKVQIAIEQEEKAKNQSPDPNNTGIEEVNSILRGMQEAEAGNANVNTN